MPKKNSSRKPSSRQLILNFFLENIGSILESKEIQDASGGVVEFARRIRELRNEHGYQILTHKDLAELKPGQYLMKTDRRVPAFKREISKETRAFVLDRNGFTCQMCGLAAGDEDSFNPSRSVRLTIGHIIDKSKGGSDNANNLKAICSTCNEGLGNTSIAKPDQVQLLTQIRRAKIDDQLAVLEWLRKKFGEEF